MNFLKNLLLKLSNKRSIDQINKNKSILTLKNILSEPKFQSDKNLLKHGYKIFSQQDEDGIIDEIFKRIESKTKIFVEIGVETGIECNTTNLLYQNWSGLWIESNTDYVETIKNNFSKFLKSNLKVHNSKALPSNINDILEKYYDIGSEVDLLSIDIGVHTFHTLEAIKNINPRVIVTEYNAKYGPKINWKVDYDADAEWDKTDYFGGSLSAFVEILKNKNYSLVGCNITGVNAFFVRNDELKDKFEKNYSSIFHYQPDRYWLKKAFDKSYKSRIK